MSMAIVWFVAGLVIGVSGSWAAPRLWPRARAFAQAHTPYVIAGGLVIACGVAAAIIHSAVTSRRTLAASVSHETAPPASPAASSASAGAQSMQAAVAGLEARLARQGGSDSDWELLARAYDFLGRPDEAKRARAHVASPAASAPGGMGDAMSLETLIAEANSVGNASAPATATAAAQAAAPAPPPATLAELRRRVQDHPQEPSGWLALADFYRAQHDNAGARDALAKVVALHGMTAQSWADYADVLASAGGGSLAGAAGKAIDAALALDPANPKALWLKASQAHEQHQYAAALDWWQKLRAVLPADSPDVRIIDGNIAEDTQLGGITPAATTGVASTRTPPAPAGGEVSGTVSVDSRLASHVQPEATLFIYAKAADSPGPPLAVLRTTTTTWPVRFHLDDTMAMLPSRRLSQFDKVVVEARISRSGQATPGSGDLYATSPTLNPAAGQRLALVINREIN